MDTDKVASMQIRQGDVLLVAVKSLPEGCKEVAPDRDRIVLAYGKITGHAHAIAGHVNSAARADEIADSVGARAQAKARLMVAPNGELYLQVRETVTLCHEEHDALSITPGIYHLPRQVEYSPAELRRVED